MLEKIRPGIIALLFLFALTSIYGQGFDSTQIGKKYPFIFPILGDKSYTRGYKMPLPHAVMINSVFNKQNMAPSMLNSKYLFHSIMHLDFNLK